MDDLFVIWSNEHQAWWRPNEVGYADNLAEAGVYHKARAFAIVMRANVVEFHECAIPLKALIGAERLGG